MITNEVLVERVRKLLAKAESTTNSNEAEAFSAKAAALIAMHRLDEAHVRDALERGTLGLRRVPIGRGAYVRARLALLSAVAVHHECEVVFETSAAGTTAVVAGFETDLEVTELLYTSLHAQAAAQMLARRERTPAATQRYRRAFLFGYAKRVAELLAESRRPTVRTVAARGEPAPARAGDLPDVVERTRRVQEFAAGAFGRVVAAAPPRPASGLGWQHGHRAAAGADLGRRRLRGRPALGRGR